MSRTLIRNVGRENIVCVNCLGGYVVEGQG